MTQFEKILTGLKILYEYGNGCDVVPEHNAIYVHMPDGVEVAKYDVGILEGVGWEWDYDLECWRIYT